MHGLSEIGPNVPAFLIKLWKLVNDPETDELICWSESNLSFIIHQPARFARELLSMYYKHNNMASFIRQLNMYGFHKIVSESGGLKNDKDWMEFAHQCFIKDHPYLLENIKRKLPNPKAGVVSSDQFTNTNVKNGTQSEILAKVLSDVNNLKGKQESWDARLASMKRENEALWRELAIFRQKHLKQEQIINRLIHFIVTMVQPSRNVPLRRRYPLMLNDIQPVKKITKISGADVTNINQGSPTGPTIHEIDTTDVLFKSPEKPDQHTNDTEFISTKIMNDKPTLKQSENVDSDSIENNSGETTDNIPEDWLEVEMTEGDLIDPLTPIDPAKINPAVAAATLKQLEGTNKIKTPIAITIPSVPTSSESGKKGMTEKKIIYLTDENTTQKTLKRKRPVILKLELNKKGSSDNESDHSASSANLLELALKEYGTSGKGSASTPTTVVKRKLVPTKPSPPIIVTGQKDLIKKEYGDKDSPDDPFLKLDSLYNGTYCEDQLFSNSPKETLDTNIIQSDNLDTLVDQERFSPADLVGSNVLTPKGDSENTESTLSFDPDSMAIVCQQPSPADTLTRELNSHVDSVQGEIDYLKEMLKGEGYTFDTNNLPWIFNDDPLSYGLLPPAAEDDTDEKKTEEGGISGNELMTYGAPSLMDLVDMMGSTPNNEDWTSLPTPPVTDLTTPSPSPSTFNFSSPAKRRKK
ncbi:hypothetical protein RUM44_010824 [Polyplax serrata]|uniref:HSF-type DNA-binding domain-containing protein n=1 Tax=Polyplax serrata TaxID=468196 RepID=A0ABR1ANA0_POLSC